MPLWLVSSCRWQTRKTSVNWAVFAAPCLLFLDHNWNQRWRNISLADAANRRNIPPFDFSFFRVSYHKRHILSLIIARVNIYHHLLINEVAETLLCYSTCWKLRCNFSTSHFPTCSDFFASCIATFHFLNLFAFSHIFIPTKFTFVFCMFFNSCNDGLAGRER